MRSVFVKNKIRVREQMQAEEAMGDLPGGDERLTSLEERGDPSGADMGIERCEHVIDHPEDGLATLGLAEMIALTGVMHLLDSQLTGSDEGLEELEVISTTGVDHRHGRQRKVDALSDLIMIDGLPNGLEGGADFHKLTQISLFTNTNLTDLTE